jgi:cytochrome c-type biogenesis protein CcmF
VHLGVVAIAFGLAASQSYSHEATNSMRVGDEVTVAGHTFELVGLREEETSRASVSTAEVLIDGEQVFEPAISEFPNAGQAIGTPSVQTSLRQDIYLSLGPGTDFAEGVISLRVIVAPMVVWLWIGGLMMFVGTFLSAFPGRRRDPLDPVSAPAAIELEAAAR